MAEPATPATRMVRVAEDLATMAGDIVEVEGGSVAALLDPILRETLTRRHEAAKPAIEQIRAAKESFRQAREAIANTKSER